MAQDVSVPAAGAQVQGQAHGGEHGARNLGPFLCWAVVFADIGTSVYYVPGILYGQPGIGVRAGLFVFLTMVVFLLLILKYAEVSVRFPEGGGVVTVASRALNPWAGAVGGMFILVDYFLTSAISSLSGLQYFATVFPSVLPVVLLITIIVLVLLGILNYWGIKESAAVSAVIAVAAAISDVVILVAVFATVPLAEIGRVLGELFGGQGIPPLTLLTGFSGAFLAFSGLESISQLSPVMRAPRRHTVDRALTLVLITVGGTSPLLTLFSTTLLADRSNPDTFISQLGAQVGGPVIGVATAVTAAALLIFASNTAIIGAYHVFLALSRMRFFPAIVERTDSWRKTPYVAIILATVIPIIVLVAVRGEIVILGDLYAFGLLGAFSLTCISLDVIRRRERRGEPHVGATDDEDKAEGIAEGTTPPATPLRRLMADRFGQTTTAGARQGEQPVGPLRAAFRRVWPDAKYYLGFLTTFLVIVAWATNLVAKPHATIFGGGLTILGVLVSVVHYRYQERAGTPPAFPIEARPIPGSVLVVLRAGDERYEDVIEAAVASAGGRTLVFSYLAQPIALQLRILQINDQYLHDREAQRVLSRAVALSSRARVTARTIYVVGDASQIVNLWRRVKSDEIIAAKPVAKEISFSLPPEYVRYQMINGVRIAHLVRHHVGDQPSASRADRRYPVGAGTGAPATPRLPERPPTGGRAPEGTGGRRSDANEPPGTPEMPSSSGGSNTIEDWVWTGTDLVRKGHEPPHDDEH